MRMNITAIKNTETQYTRTARHVLNVILRDPLALMSSIIILVFILLAIFAPLVAPYPDQGQGKTNASDTMQPPSSSIRSARTGLGGIS